MTERSDTPRHVVPGLGWPSFQAKTVEGHGHAVGWRGVPSERLDEERYGVSRETPLEARAHAIETKPTSAPNPGMSGEDIEGNQRG